MTPASDGDHELQKSRSGSWDSVTDLMIVFGLVGSVLLHLYLSFVGLFVILAFGVSSLVVFGRYLPGLEYERPQNEHILYFFVGIGIVMIL